MLSVRFVLGAGALSHMRAEGSVLKISVSCLLGLTLGSCSDATKPEGGPDTFPQVAGFRWIYERSDETSGITDTLSLSTIGTAFAANGRVASVWEMRTSQAVWQDTVWTVGDTVLVQRSAYAGTHFGLAAYVFPMEVGAMWRSPSDGGPTRVERDSTLYPLPSGAWIWKAFLLREEWQGSKQSGIVETW